MCSEVPARCGGSDQAFAGDCVHALGPHRACVRTTPATSRVPGRRRRADGPRSWPERHRNLNVELPLQSMRVCRIGEGQVRRRTLALYFGPGGKSMKSGQLRRAMAAGIAFVVLFVAGVFLNFGDTPNIKSSDTNAAAAQKWVTELSGSGHRAGLIVSAYLLILAGLAFLWFTTGVRAWLAPDLAIGRIISCLGVLGAAAMAAAGMGGASVAGSVSFGNEPVPQNGDAIRLVMETFYPFLFVVFGLVSAALIATVAVAVMRTGILPRWVAYTGWIAVLGSLAGVVFLPFVLPLLWYLVVSIVGLSRASPAPVAVTGPTS